MQAPTRSSSFDAAYRAPLTPWGDIRIPPQIRALAQLPPGARVLELGCGIGRLSRFMARQGHAALGVDFSAVAIERARAASRQESHRPEFQVGDVTALTDILGAFDAAFDVGCFHCLDTQGQRAYVREIARLLKPGATHLIWAMDRTPSDVRMSPEVLAPIVAPAFMLRDARPNRRRWVASHWYWLTSLSPTARPAPH